MASILVVEDHPLNLQLVRDLLEYRGHRVESATCVEEAIESLAARRPDLVVLDVHIPGGGGGKVLRAIRADPELADLPVVAVTAQAMAGDRELLLDEGFDGYLPKPIEVSRFGPAIERFLAPGPRSRG